MAENQILSDDAIVAEEIQTAVESQDSNPEPIEDDLAFEVFASRCPSHA
jgi:hypothetical protein